MTSALFTPATLRSLTVANRIVVSPMCQYSAIDGRATDWHLVHLGGLAASGAGMLIIEATAVTPEGRITPSCLGLWDELTQQALVPVFRAIRSVSSIAVVQQIAHAGRKASCAAPWKGGARLAPDDGGWVPEAPSPLAHNELDRAPSELDAEGLQRIRDAFAATARRSIELGADGIEVHGAHGYLLHEFLSPLANRRSDRYGGSLENRLRYPLEVFDAVRAAVPRDKPVGFRVSATDWVDGGWDLEQTIALAHELARRGVDWITASSGGVSPHQKIAAGPGYQVPFAEAIKQATGVTTFAVGLITTPTHAEDILSSGKADFVALARAMLYDPRWGWHAAAALGETIKAPPQYLRAAPHEHRNLFEQP